MEVVDEGLVEWGAECGVECGAEWGKELEWELGGKSSCSWFESTSIGGAESGEGEWSGILWSLIKLGEGSCKWAKWSCSLDNLPSPSSFFEKPKGGEGGLEGARDEEGECSAEGGLEWPKWITRASAAGPPFESENSLCKCFSIIS